MLACVPAYMMCVFGNSHQESAVDEDRQDKEEKKAVVDNKVVEIKLRGQKSSLRQLNLSIST